LHGAVVLMEPDSRTAHVNEPQEVDVLANG
jgi:hypothetical protein